MNLTEDHIQFNEVADEYREAKKLTKRYFDDWIRSFSGWRYDRLGTLYMEWRTEAALAKNPFVELEGEVSPFFVKECNLRFPAPPPFLSKLVSDKQLTEWNEAAAYLLFYLFAQSVGDELPYQEATMKVLNGRIMGKVKKKEEGLYA